MVVGIRSGQDTAADSFRQLMSRITNEQFPFNNFSRLDRWLDQKHKELCYIRKFQLMKLKIKIRKSKQKFFVALPPERCKSK